ncbi:class A sortase [Holzapfeliella floricola]|uniref:Sortase n=1 Tax=Holzapfeliella floricola DSM 23037 = JCM 16512 TaxID=1423744 RepID=A0A0R2DI70_9LACO|nr:class A sortase [Holzapfeliella floricola]KRN03784.1 sortase [Holzapfeliella floricola DSM 23037 = JCM 16512]
MKKIKQILLYLAAVILLTIGLTLIFNEPIQNMIVSHNTETVRTAITRDQIQKNMETKNDDYDFSKVKSLDINQVGQALTHNQTQVIGLIAIPSVSLNLPISKGLSDAALSAGGGTMRENQKMGVGNYPLAGHYMTSKGLLFSPLESVEIGELIYLTDLDKIYIYKIYQKEVVDPYAVWLADNTSNSIVTLITCADGGVNRWAIRGELIETKNATNPELAVFNLK